MKMRVLINGALGHMGQAVLTALNDGSGDMVLAAGIDLQKGDYPVPLFSSAKEVDVPFDVAVDFSRPEATMAVLELCLRKNRPLVTGTTGMSETDICQLREASKVIPVFYSRNMSIGVNLQIALTRAATRILGETFDTEIVETHHNLKVDAPSGTALMIAEAVKDARAGETTFVFGRQAINKRRDKNEVGIHSLRGGNIAGEHSVYFLGPDEEIIITHRAGSKLIFAKGALNAAAFVLMQKPGFYTMEDIISI